MNNIEEITNTLLAAGTFDYGAIMQPVELLNHYGIDLQADEDMAGWSVSDIRKQITRNALTELALVDKIRDILIDEGRYIGKTKGVYRVYLPSENEQVSSNYLRSASRKTSKASRLRQATPVEARESSNTSSRAAISARRSSALTQRSQA